MVFQILRKYKGFEHNPAGKKTGNGRLFSILIIFTGKIGFG